MSSSLLIEPCMQGLLKVFIRALLKLHRSRMDYLSAKKFLGVHPELAIRTSCGGYRGAYMRRRHRQLLQAGRSGRAQITQCLRGSGQSQRRRPQPVKPSKPGVHGGAPEPCAGYATFCGVHIRPPSTCVRPLGCACVGLVPGALEQVRSLRYHLQTYRRQDTHHWDQAGPFCVPSCRIRRS